MKSWVVIDATMGQDFFRQFFLLRFFNMCCPYLMAVDTKSMGLSFVRHLLDFSSNQNRMTNEKSPTDRISIWFANEMQRDEIRRRWIPFFGFLAKRFQLQTVWFFFFLFSFLPSFVISFHTSSFDNLINASSLVSPEWMQRAEIAASFNSLCGIYEVGIWGP